MATMQMGKGIKVVLGGALVALGLLAGNLGPGAAPAGAQTPSPDLTVSVTTSRSKIFVDPHDTVDYTITMRNNGGAWAAGFSARVDFSNTGDPVVVTQPEGQPLCRPVPAAKQVTCSNLGLPANSSVSLGVRVKPITAGTITGAATIDSGGVVAESNEANNQASRSVTVARRADLRVQLSSTAVAASAGAVVNFTIQVSNVGPGAATNGFSVDLTRLSTLPLDFVSVPAGCTRLSNAFVKCNRSTSLAPGQTVSFTIGATVGFSWTTVQGIVTASALAVTGDGEINTADNSDADSFKVLGVFP